MFSRVTRQIIGTNRVYRTLVTKKYKPSGLLPIDYAFLRHTISNYNQQNILSLQGKRKYSDNIELTEAQFLDICEDTLQSLYEVFEEISDKHLSDIKDADVVYEGGILKVDIGSHGIYVINRQTPNKQIWLSSPVSGPKRYDFIRENDKTGYWTYKHDGVTLHKLLQTEFSSILSRDISFSECSYCKL